MGYYLQDGCTQADIDRTLDGPEPEVETESFCDHGVSMWVECLECNEELDTL